MASRSIDIKHLFCYELDPIPTDIGDIRILKQSQS